MDPWQPCSTHNSSGGDSISEATTTNVDGLVELHNEDKSQENLERNSAEENNQNQTSQEELSFGDNFQPFVKLPDSQEYLESLEKKLKVIQKGGPKGANADSILRSLGQTKESCMIKLLSNSVEKLTVEGELFEELKVNPILKKLAPEKQALSAEELVHLLKADQLEIILRNNNISQDSEQLPESSTEEATKTRGNQEEPPSEFFQESEKDRDSTENLAVATSSLENLTASSKTSERQ